MVAIEVAWYPGLTGQEDVVKAFKWSRVQPDNMYLLAADVPGGRVKALGGALLINTGPFSAGEGRGGSWVSIAHRLRLVR